MAKLRPWLGRKLSLFVGLAVAAVRACGADRCRAPRASRRRSFVRFEQGVQLAGFLGKGEPPRELERWVEEQVLQASNDDVTQTDFADGGEEPDTHLVQGTRHRVFLLNAFDSDRQITVGGSRSASFTMRGISSRSLHCRRWRIGSSAI